MPRNRELVRAEYLDLPRRRIPRDICQRWGYGVAESVDGAPAQVATYWDPRGVSPVAQKVRWKGKEFAWRGDPRSAGLFGEHLWKGGGRRVVVTEGEIDCLAVASLNQGKYPVVSVPNGAQGAAEAIRARLEFFDGFEEVVLLFDMDAPGREASEAAARVLRPGQARIGNLPLKDAGAMVEAGRLRDLQVAIYEAKPWRPDRLVDGPEVWPVLMDRPVLPSTEWPWPKVQGMTLGWRDTELVMLIGGVSVGKTTLALGAMHALLGAEVKTGFVGLETPMSESVRVLLGLATGENLTVDAAWEEADKDRLRGVYKDSIEPWVAFLDQVGPMDPDELLDRIRYLIVGLGCRRVILDNLTMALAAVGGDKAVARQDEFLGRLAAMAQTTGAGIMVVCHLSKPDSRGGGYEEGRQVPLHGARGSMTTPAFVAVALGAERNLQAEDEGDRNVVQLRVLKARKGGATGPGDRLEYRREKGALRVLDESDWAEEVAEVTGASELEGFEVPEL